VFYHVSFAVPDIEAAMHQLTEVVGVRWSPVLEDTFAGWQCRLTFTVGDGPAIELVTGPAGSPWAGGPRFHHLAVWTEDVGQGSRRLAEQGYPVSFDACPLGRPYAYHEVPAVGALVELMDVSRQQHFLATWPQRNPVLTTLEQVDARH
jgi:hypothetical protein